MHVQPAPLAFARDLASARQAVPAETDQGAGAADAVVSAAVLVASAFRLRDEGGLIATLRLLTDAVAAWEAGQAAA